MRQGDQLKYGQICAERGAAVSSRAPYTSAGTGRLASWLATL